MKSKSEFTNLAYGMFIHYGLYSIYGRGEWVMSRERMTNEEYFSVEPQFRNDPEFAEQWVKLAAESGMRYAVLTTRHHDGYFIGDALVRSFCDNCRKYGLKVGLYYSVGDWSDFDFRAGTAGPNWERFVEKTHRQLKELMTEYGEVDYLFYDGCPSPASWRAKELHAELRRLQPGLLISCRCGLDEDVFSSEQNSRAHDGVWESCYTLNNSWGYTKHDDQWKTAADVIPMLMGIRHNGGNLLLNVAPLPDGSIQQEALDVLKQVSDWLAQNGEAVYGVEPHPFNYKDQEISVGRGNTAYIMLIRDWNGILRKICGIGNRIKSISLLASDKKVAFEQKGDVISLTGLPPRNHGALPRVLKLELDGAPVGVHNPMWPEGDFRVC